ncbi:P-loop containing nucleoside triphosphate hydrolase protein [Pisolithus microcarpus]|nr:P-loop containing nucleoside triphosphate hydrolase protein [Pisolithus microcarpus]
MGHSELGITVRSGALMQPTLSSNAVLPKGTPSAIGALRLRKSAVFQSYSTPFRNRNLNLISPQINSTPTKAVDEEGSDTELEQEEANFILEAARAQHNMCILEQQLAAAKVDETIALGNLYQFRAQTAEHKLEDANIDVGRIRHDIRKSGIVLHNPCKCRRASFTESTVACTYVHVNTEDINVPRWWGSSHHKFITRLKCKRSVEHDFKNSDKTGAAYLLVTPKCASKLADEPGQDKSSHLRKLLVATSLAASASVILEYWDTSPGKSHLHPHVFQLASNAYYHMRRTAQDQSILFSGETTRGKSENRHLAIKTFHEFSISNPRKKGAKLSLPQSSSSKCLEMHAPSLIRTLLGLASPSPEACQVVAAILHLGNLEFTINRSRDVDAAVMRNIDTLALIAESLGVQPSALENALSYKTKLVKKELCTVFLDSDGASDNRNDLAKTLYSLLFAWLNEHINQRLCRDDFNTFIGLFDLPGPQNMTGRSNSLDQFCINFANEQLHHFVQQRLFELHVDEYQSEECVRLFQNRPGGLIHIVDDQARWSHKKTDHTMLGGGLDRSGFPTFTICLFNGLVTYSSEAFLEHNLDALNSDFAALLRGTAVGTGIVDGGEGVGSINPFVQAPTITEEERKDEDVTTPQNTGTPCVTGKFCAALDTLFDTLGDTQNWFVFCINPNDSQLPNQLEERSVKGQVRSAGLVEVAKWVQGSNVQGGRDGTPAEQIERMRVALGLGETDVVLGQHKVFLSQATFHAMEDYLRAADVEEQKHNWMCEAEVEASPAVGQGSSFHREYDEEYDEAKMVQSDGFNGRSRLTGNQDDSNSNYGTESYPPSNMFQHVDKEGLMAKDPLPGRPWRNNPNNVYTSIRGGVFDLTQVAVTHQHVISIVPHQVGPAVWWHGCRRDFPCAETQCLRDLGGPISAALWQCATNCVMLGDCATVELSYCDAVIML